jgi:hypothetical protein
MIWRYQKVILGLCWVLILGELGSICVAGVLLYADQVLAAFKILVLSSILCGCIASLYPLVRWLGKNRPEFLSAPGRSLERILWVITHEAAAGVCFSLAVVIAFLPLQSWVQGVRPSWDLPWECWVGLVAGGISLSLYGLTWGGRLIAKASHR